MKRISAVVMSVIVSMFAVSVSYAQTEATPSASDESRKPVRVNKLNEQLKDARDAHKDAIRDAVQQNRDEVKQTIEERKEELRARLAQRLQMTRERRLSFAYNRISSMVARMKKLAERVQSRIDKEEEKGTDITEADQYLDLADEAIANAESALIGLKELLDTLPAAEEPGAMTDDIRTAIQEVKEHLQTAHEALRNAIAALKEARMPASANAL